MSAFGAANSFGSSGAATGAGVDLLKNAMYCQPSLEGRARPSG
jgi:hypothetical protein